jgi:competence protein ComEC
MRQPLVAATLSFVFGLVCGRVFLFFPVTSIIAVIALAIATFLLSRSRNFSRIGSFILVAFIAAGMTMFIVSARRTYTESSAIQVDDRSVHELVGTIESPLDRDIDRFAFDLDLQEIDSESAHGHLRVSVKAANTTAGCGDTVRVFGTIRKAGGFVNPRGFDYAAYLSQRGISAVVNVKSSDRVTIIRHVSGVFRAIQNLRERIRLAFLASLHGSGSAIVQAMTLGEEGELTDEMRDAFMAAGVTHIISISGSHLGMLALLCFGLCRQALFLLPERLYHRLTIRSDPKKIAALMTLPLVVFYTLLAGAQVATVRSLIMIAAGIAAVLFDRDNALGRSLSLAALAILGFDPQALFDISFQLSFLSVLVIAEFVIRVQPLMPKPGSRLARFRNDVLILIGVSLTASLATAPLTAFYFNQVSLAGIVSNIVVVPFAGAVVVPLGLLSGILSLWLGHLPFVWLNQTVSDVFIAIVTFFSHMPFADFHPPAPNIAWIAVYAVFVVSLASILFTLLRARLVLLETPKPVGLLPKIGIAVSGIFLVLCFALPVLAQKKTVLSFPDVGQGDCSLIELASGKSILIDGGGTRDNRFDIGRRVVAPSLWNRGIHRIDLVVLSHPHSDHMNGLLFVLDRFDVREVWTHGYDTDLEGYEQFANIIARKQIRHRVVSSADQSFMLGDAALSVLHPAADFRSLDRKAYGAQNSRSLVLRVEDHGKTYLFTGDIGVDAERFMLQHKTNVRCDVLKMPHHGSKTSSSAEFVAAAHPQIAVASVGANNLYGHPNDDVIERYEQAGAQVCRTDKDGAVIVEENQGRLKIVKWRDMVLRQAGMKPWTEWSTGEKQNWARVWERMRGY